MKIWNCGFDAHAKTHHGEPWQRCKE